MTTFDAAYLSQVVKTTRNSPHGIASYFYKLNKKWGFKTFGHKYDRDYAYGFQSELYELGMAPQPGQKFDNPCGYITEVVEVVRDFVETAGPDGNCYTGTRDYLALREEFENEIDKFCMEKLQPAGYCIGDAHLGNFGFKDGHLVVIDFGYESFDIY